MHTRTCTHPPFLDPPRPRSGGIVLLIRKIRGDYLIPGCYQFYGGTQIQCSGKLKLMQVEVGAEGACGCELAVVAVKIYILWRPEG